MPITKATASSIAPAAKGDLVVGSATNDAAVLGVGSNDQVLTADSSTATGLKWATASSGGAMTLLASGNLPATGLTLSSISGSYEQLFLKIMDVDPSVSTGMRFRFNSDTGSNYNFTSIINPSTSVVTDAVTSATSISIPYETFSTTANGAYISLALNNYSDTIGYKQFTMQSSYINNPYSTITNVQRVGFWKDESAISTIAFIGDAGGNWLDGGSYELWGIK